MKEVDPVEAFVAYIVEKARQALSGKAANQETKEEVSGEVEMPESPKEIKALGEEEAAAIAKNLGIDTEDLSHKQVIGLLLSVNLLVNDDLDDADDVKALAKAMGIKASKKTSETVVELKKFFEAESSEEGDDAESSEEGESSEEESESDESEKSEESEEESSEESAEESAEESSEGEEESSEEESSEETEGEEESSEEVEEVSEEEQLKRYNKVAKTTYKKYETIKKLLTDDDGNVASWGDPYIKNGSAWCCGMEMTDIKVKEGKKLLDAAQCKITGTKWTFDGEAFTQVE